MATTPEAMGEARWRRASGSRREERRVGRPREGRGKRNRRFLRMKKGERGGRRPIRKRDEVAVTSYNIRDGRNEGLLSAARALDHANVDVAVVREVKIKDPKFASKKGFGYSILATAAGTDNCGGVALLARENDLCSVEEAKPWGPNVISWEMQVGLEEKECQ